MTDLDQHLGRIAATNAELGAFVAYRALMDLLQRHGHHEARELLELFGEDAIRFAFTSESWANEELPAAGDAAVPTNKSA